MGKKNFSGTAGGLRYAKENGVTIVEGDLNGDKIADFQIELAGGITPVVADFVF